MSIKPIDYINIISKSQEVAKVKQVENNKTVVQFEQGVIQQERKVNQNLNRVRDTNKGEYRVIDNKERGNRKNNKNKNQKDRKDAEKNNEDNKGTNKTIDIRI